MGGWNPLEQIEDYVTDAVDFVGDILDDTLGWLNPIPEIPDFGEMQIDQNAKGVLLNKFSSNSFIPVVYGTRRVGGNVVFLETSGTDNEFLYMAIVLSEGEINGITSIFVNDKELTLSGSIADNTQRTIPSTDANFFDAENTASLITVEPHFGTDTQSASSLLQELDSWTSSHKLSGLAYLALKFTWNPNKFGSLPTVQAVVQGRKVYNPNLDSTVTGGSGSHRKDDNTTWAYSANPILQLLDYLRNDRFGMGITNSYFDTNFADWQTATDVCDTQVTPFTGASQIDLMNSHVVVDTSRKAIDNVKSFISGARAYLNFSAGQYKILVETTGSASITLTEDNILNGITISSRNKNSRFNRVIVNFVNPDKNFQSDSAQFPPVDETNITSTDRHASLKTDDGELLLEGRFDFPMFASPYQAQEMAEIILRRSRSSLEVALTADATALDLSVGDIVNITHATPSFSAKPFRVQALQLNADHTIQLQCSEHQDSYYTFGTQREVAEIPDTTLPNPFSVQAPVLTVTDELRSLNEEAINVLIAEVSATDKFVIEFEVQAKKTTESNYVNLGKGQGAKFELPNVEDNAIYDVRARSVTSVSRSDFVTTQHQVVGKTEPPADVTNFQINIVGTEAHLTWQPVSDLDLSHYVIRHSPLTSGAIFSNAINLVDKVSRPANTATVPALTGTYFVRAVDKLGLASLNATSNITLIDSIKNLNQVATSTQHTGFAGTKTNVVDIGSALVLDTTNDFEDVSGNFDDALGSFDGGGGAVQTTGTYEFNTHIDVGGVFTNRITATVLSERLDYINLFDDATGNFDDRSGVFDGDVNTYGDTNVELQIARTTDDPASASPTYTAFQRFNVGDYVGRGFKFKAILTSTNVQSSPKITQLSVQVDMPDRVFSETDVSSGTDTNGKVITYSPAFKAIQGIGISASNLASGDYYVITNKSATGFTIEFFNSSNSTIDRTFDYVVRGFGELST